MRKILTLIVVVITALSMSAVIPKLNKAPKLNQSRSEVLKKATDKKAASKDAKMEKFNKKPIRHAKPAAFRAPAKASENNNEVVFDQSFTFLTEGSPESPVAIETDDNYNIPESMIGADNYGWGGENIYQAGGSLYMPYLEDEYAYLLTPDIYQAGIYTITIEARSTAEESEIDTYLVGYDEENGYGGIGWEETYINNEWNTYTVTWNAADYPEYNSFYLEFDSYTADVMIRNIKVEVETAALPTPEANEYSNFTGTSFLASWNAVEGAQKYLLNVAQVDEYGDNVEPSVIEDLEVEGTEHVVDITPGIIYRYWVYAVDAEGNKSFKSNEVEVATLLPPSNIRGSIREDLSGFDAEWDAAPGANAYILQSSLYRKAPAEGEFVLTEADFSDIESTGTLDEPLDDYFLDSSYDQMPGWTFWLGATVNGAAGFVEDATLAYFYGVLGMVESGEFDLSNVKDGAVTVDMKAASATGKALYVGLFTYNEETDEYEVMSSARTDALTSEFADYSVTLKGGGKQSVILIMTDSENYDGNAFFQSIKVTAEAEAGQFVGVPSAIAKFMDSETSASIDAPCNEGDYYTVIITSYTLDDEGYLYISGQTSEPAVIGEASGIENVENSNSDAPARYFNLQGMRVAKPASGSVVIRLQGDKATKILVK